MITIIIIIIIIMIIIINDDNNNNNKKKAKKVSTTTTAKKSSNQVRDCITVKLMCCFSQCRVNMSDSEGPVHWQSASCPPCTVFYALSVMVSGRLTLVRIG